jgi:glucuronide carrier protein
VQLYYLRDVLGSVQLYSVMSLIQLALTFGMAGFIPKIVRKFGKRNAYMGGAAFMIVGGMMILFAPSGSVALGFSGLVVAYVGIMLVNMLVWALEADTVEYGEWKTGVRTEGITYALFSFTRKTGQAVGGALAAYALAWGGYAAGAAEQSAHAEWGIRAATGLIPAIAALLAILVMVFYPLTDKRHAEIVRAIAERRAENGQASPVTPELSTASFSIHRGPNSAPPVD